jgi:hypothetical protein
LVFLMQIMLASFLLSGALHGSVEKSHISLPLWKSSSFRYVHGLLAHNKCNIVIVLLKQYDIYPEITIFLP